MIKQGQIQESSRILYVNDGSKDKTWGIICNLAASDDHYEGIMLNRNYGHQNALLAGLMKAKDYCDITISIDCDGQDDIHAMNEMVDAYQLDNCEVVYGARRSRKSDRFLKRFTAESFYRIMGWMGAEVVFNHADYRLIGSRALKELAEFKEANLFLRGIVPLIGLKSTIVCYDRAERLAGQTHYSPKKMLALAADVITSLSIRPLHMITVLGLIVSAISFLGIIWAVVGSFLGKNIDGWTSLVCIICLIGGIQLLCLGVIGGYIGKIYIETKARPRYIISEYTENKKNPYKT